jgi:hypothetical protein
VSSAGGSPRVGTATIKCPGKPNAIIVVVAALKDNNVFLVRSPEDYPVAIQPKLRAAVAKMVNGIRDTTKLALAFDDLMASRAATDPEEKQDLRQDAHEGVCVAALRESGLAKTDPAFASCKQLAPGRSFPQ